MFIHKNERKKKKKKEKKKKKRKKKRWKKKTEKKPDVKYLSASQLVRATSKTAYISTALI